MNIRKYKSYLSGTILSVILVLILFNVFCSKPPSTVFIKAVKFSHGVVANQDLYGAFIGEDGKQAPPQPWRIQSEITVDEGMLKQLRGSSQNGKLDFKASINFESEKHSFTIEGSDFRENGSTLMAHFDIKFPLRLFGWKFGTNPVNMVVEVTAQGSYQAGILLLLPFFDGGDTKINGEEEISEEIEKFEPRRDGDDTILNGPSPPVPILSNPEPVTEPEPEPEPEPEAE